MVIYKIYNNNVVQTYDDQLQEMIVMGSGIAFQKKAGDWIDERKIERKFVLQDAQQQAAIAKLLAEIPVEQFELSEKVILHAEGQLKKSLNESIHVTLADHISFSISRQEKGFVIYNPMLLDIKNMYEAEYGIGLFALELVRRQLGVVLPEDEAGFIAMHIIDAELNQQNLAVSTIMKITGQIIKIVKYQFKIDIDEDSLIYNRFLTHLKFFAQRIIKKEQIVFDYDELFKSFVANYPRAYKIACKIKDFVESNYDYTVNDDELFYLCIHIQRLERGREEP